MVSGFGLLDFGEVTLLEVTEGTDPGELLFMDAVVPAGVDVSVAVAVEVVVLRGVDVSVVVTSVEVAVLESVDVSVVVASVEVVVLESVDVSVVISVEFMVVIEDLTLVLAAITSADALLLVTTVELELVAAVAKEPIGMRNKDAKFQKTEH